ncbi:MAG TPA: EamA family transporter, partial [Candidatus Limnocylindria bacterium]|nr:EamA family transporter [Candidatus Limnocylindria bacterium]
LVAYLTPVSTLVLAFFILGERPLPLQLAGGVVVVVGVRVAARRATDARAQLAAEPRGTPA